MIRRIKNNRFLFNFIGDEKRIRRRDAACVHEDFHNFTPTCFLISSSTFIVAIVSSWLTIGGRPRKIVSAKASASSAYKSIPAFTSNSSAGGVSVFPPSCRGGALRLSQYFAPRGCGFHGQGTSIYPSLPQMQAVLSACTRIPQVKPATTPLANFKLP